MDPMLSNGSRGILMSYTDRSVQRRLKSNAPNDSFGKRGKQTLSLTHIHTHTHTRHVLCFFLHTNPYFSQCLQHVVI